MRERLGLVLLPFVFLGTGCAFTPDSAGSQEKQYSMVVIPGQKFTVHWNDLTLTKDRRLKLIGNDVDLPIKSVDDESVNYDVDGYLIRITPTDNKSLVPESFVTVTCNCPDIAADSQR